jgi:hypothetical protein
MIVQLADRFKQPFEYFEKLDVTFVNKLFIIIQAENEEQRKAMDSAKRK